MESEDERKLSTHILVGILSVPHQCVDGPSESAACVLTPSTTGVSRKKLTHKESTPANNRCNVFTILSLFFFNWPTYFLWTVSAPLPDIFRHASPRLYWAIHNVCCTFKGLRKTLSLSVLLWSTKPIINPFFTAILWALSLPFLAYDILYVPSSFSCIWGKLISIWENEKKNHARLLGNPLVVVRITETLSFLRGLWVFCAVMMTDWFQCFGLESLLSLSFSGCLWSFTSCLLSFCRRPAKESYSCLKLFVLCMVKWSYFNPILPLNWQNYPSVQLC